MTWAMRSNGTRRRNLTNNTEHFFPDYSPNGRRIAFVHFSYKDAFSDRLVVMNPVGYENVIAPAFSPAGGRIVFATGPTPQTSGIFCAGHT